MSLSGSGYRLDFGGPSANDWLDEFRCDPNEALWALRRWKEDAINLMYEAVDYNAGSMLGPTWHVSRLAPRGGSRPMFSLPLEFQNLTDIVALWCDSELHIDPTALTEVRRRFYAFAPSNAAGPRGETIQVRVSMTDGEMEAMMHEAMDLFDRVYRATQQRPAISSKDARDKFCWEQWQSGHTYKEIFVAVKKNPQWEQFSEPLGVRSAINAWARRHSPPLLVRKGERGRRSESQR